MEYFKDCTTQEELKARYREWTLKLHPDKNPGNPNAEAEFKEMQQQYEERKAELNGDYTKSRKGRERREREERERKERERKERERRKVEQVVEQARLNRQKGHCDINAGDYIYARMANYTRSMFEWSRLSIDDLLRVVEKEGVKDECVVMVETIVELHDKDFLECVFSHVMPEGIWGGWEVLQTVNTSSGLKKGKRVAKVVMFRSAHYCVFGNPMGDQVISDYYMWSGYESMFSSQLLRIRQTMEREREERERAEIERKLKLLAEQSPLIEEWRDKLIQISAGLSETERKTVALDNMKKMLKSKFPGTTFKQRFIDGALSWTDGPTYEDVLKVTELFNCGAANGYETTPWMELFGKATVLTMDRKMSVLTKAKILQQLGQVTMAFRNGTMSDEVPMSDLDWTMLHALVGIDIRGKRNGVGVCHSTIHRDGHRSVTPLEAVRFVFDHTSYVKTKTAKKKAV